jgi:hydroxymethylbilane synthase
MPVGAAPLRIATRGSALALWQAEHVAALLRAAAPDVAVEVLVVDVAADRRLDIPIWELGGKGVFAKEVQAAVLDGRADLAVHSYKDLPSRSPDGLIIAAVPERLDAADVLLVRPEAADASAGDLPLRAGARVGTSAARRKALLAAARPDLEIGLLRGNVPTRVRALLDGRFDAIVLAAAGIARLDRASGTALVPADIVRVRLDPKRFVPAPAQGAIAIQVRDDAPAVIAAVRSLNDDLTTNALRAERALLGLAEAGCVLPFGAWCDTSEERLHLYTVLGQENGAIARCDTTGTDPEVMAAKAWTELSSGVPA